MTASTVQHPSVRTAFTGLIDYAGLFPPAALEVEAASREYDEARAGTNAWMLGRFITPARGLRSSLGLLRGPFSVIVDADLEALNDIGALRSGGAPIEVIEISAKNFPGALGALGAHIAGAQLQGLPVFVEIPRVRGWGAALSTALEFLSRNRFGAKLRCGGLKAEAFPSVDEVVEFIMAASAANVPFKATAGLHHPVRHVDPATGFTMHGFLNILAAAALAPRADAPLLQRVVAEEEPQAFVFEPAALRWRTERIALEELEAARRERFVAYGSCSFSEPVEDLTALGVLAPQ